MRDIAELRDKANAVIRARAVMGRFDERTDRWHQERDRWIDAREEMRADLTPEHVLVLLEITEAAQAVVARWDEPLWKDVPATAEFIYRLRDALAKLTKESES